MNQRTDFLASNYLATKYARLCICANQIRHGELNQNIARTTEKTNIKDRMNQGNNWVVENKESSIWKAVKEDCRDSIPLKAVYQAEIQKVQLYHC